VNGLKFEKADNAASCDHGGEAGDAVFCGVEGFA
jgi:hypothetical protein